MKLLSRMKYMFALCFLLIGLLPSVSSTSFAAAAPAATPELLYSDEEVEMAKQRWMATIYECMDSYATVYSVLEAKATKAEAPELYKHAEDIAARLDYARYQLKQSTNMDEINAMAALITDIMKQINALEVQVEAFEVAVTFTATTVEGVEMTFMVLSEEEKTCQVWRPSSNVSGAPVAIDKATTGTVTIPETANGYHVVSICEEAFYYCPSITKVVIPISVIEIGERAFCGCSSLAQVNLPDNLKTIGSAAFYGTAIASVSIPASVTSISSVPYGDCPNLTKIEVASGNTYYDARDNCNAIISTRSNSLIQGCHTTSIPSGVRSIGWMAFKGYSGIENLYIPKTVQSISYTAFELCSGIKTIVVEDGNPVYDSRNHCNAIISTSTNALVLGCQNTIIPEDVAAIGEDAFMGCHYLKNIRLPENVKSIGGHAFEYCKSLESIVIPEGVTSIEYMAFYGCSGLQEVSIPESATAIGFCTFDGCSSLKEVVIPDNVASLDNQAFMGCSSLEKVTLGAGITRMNYASFLHCDKLMTIVSRIQEPFALTSGVFTYNDDATLYVPASTKAKYEATDGWSKFQNIVEMEDETEEMAIPDEAIDLGLPSGTKWAPWNVGASKPEESGGYYAWGETEEKKLYGWSTNKWCNGSYNTLTKYCIDSSYGIVDNKTVLDPEDDVAYVKWGGSWKMPTYDQMKELVDNCTSEWATVNGVNGRKFTGPNGNSIFIPAAGEYGDGSSNPEYVNVLGYYWSSSLSYLSEGARYFVLRSNRTELGDFLRRTCGLNVRPVIASEPAVEPVPYALWCEGNTTLYFVSSSTELKRGGTFDGQTITNVWSGETLTNTPENEDVFRYTPMPWSGINRTCTRIVFDQSFKDIRVKSTSAWIGSNVESIEGLEYLNTSEVTSMSYMFSCKNLKTIDLSHFDTHNVKYMHSMFERCSSLTELDLSSFDTRNVETMSFMFSECTSLTNLDLSSFETGNVTDMQKMFAVIDGESNLKSIDMSHFDTSNATNMYAMFYGCSKLEALDLSSFETSNVTNMEMMFSQCSSLKTIYVGRGWSTQNVEEGRGMFGRCVSLVGGQGTTFDGIHYDFTYAHIDGGADNPGYFTAKEEMAIPDEAIDLGLPSGTKWAPWNVGASKPEDYGGYYAWGETEEKDVYDWSTYIYCDGSEETCHDIGTNIAGTKYDVAHVVWGGSWKMPTWDQVKELFDNCTSEWTTVNGINGRKFTSKINGNSIFLPAAGRHDVSGLYGDGWYGFCWSSSLGSNPSLARDLSFGGPSFAGWGNYYHFYGQSVRPVIEGNKDIDPLEEDETIDFGDESGIDEEADLDGNVIGNIFFNISSGNGGYDAEEGCITVTKPTTDELLEQLEGQDIFGEDFKRQFTGVVFMVPAGSGTVKITAETTGNTTLKVKVGNGAPIEMELEGKLKASFPYNVYAPTLVYIYAGQTAAGVKAQLGAVADAAAGELKIYGIELNVTEDAIESLTPSQKSEGNIYNLSGQRLSKPRRGVNIIDGKKVVIK